MEKKRKLNDGNSITLKKDGAKLKYEEGPKKKSMS